MAEVLFMEILLMVEKGIDLERWIQETGISSLNLIVEWKFSR